MNFTIPSLATVQLLLFVIIYDLAPQGKHFSFVESLQFKHESSQLQSAS